MKYEFHPDAESEFLESVGFYESKVQGLVLTRLKRSLVWFAIHPNKDKLNVNLISGGLHFIDFRSLLCTERKIPLFKYWQLLMTEGDRNTG